MKLSTRRTGAGPQGPAGATGATGATGTQGQTGAAGTPGTKFFFGAGDPDNALTATTIIGDFYVNTTNGNVWQREASSDFNPADGADLVLAGAFWEVKGNLKGLPGTKYHFGTGDPTNALTATTAIGDYYVDNSTGNVWQREASSDFNPSDGADLVLAGAFWEVKGNLKGMNGQNAIPELTLYVSTTGNDTNSGLSLGAPLLTLSRAAEIVMEKNPLLLKLVLVDSEITDTNIKVVSGFRVFPYFNCNLQLMVPADTDLTIGTYTESGVTLPIHITCAKNIILCGEDGGDIQGMTRLIMPVIDTSAYTSPQMETFHSKNTFIFLAASVDHVPVECTLFSTGLTIQTNLFLIKNPLQNSFCRPCSFRHLMYGSISAALVQSIQNGAGIVENFTAVTFYWIPPITSRLSLTSRTVLNSLSNALQRGRSYQYSIREFLYSEDGFVESGINTGMIYWPGIADTSDFDDEIKILDFPNTAYATPKTIDEFGALQAYQAIRAELWGTSNSALTLKIVRDVNVMTLCVFEISFRAI